MFKRSFVVTGQGGVAGEVVEKVGLLGMVLEPRYGNRIGLLMVPGLGGRRGSKTVLPRRGWSVPRGCYRPLAPGVICDRDRTAVIGRLGVHQDRPSWSVNLLAGDSESGMAGDDDVHLFLVVLAMGFDQLLPS